MDRRDFLLATTVAAGAVAAIGPEIAASAKAPANLLELTLTQIAAAFADGRKAWSYFTFAPSTNRCSGP